MSALTKEQLQEVLTKHRAWLLGQADGARADLTRADLTGANLTGANLTRADLTGANLTGADLTGANLYGANLTRANLTGANLTRANLTRANLYGADLTGANLTGATIFEHWKVETYRDLLWLGPLGSRNDFLMVNLPTLRLKAGCFEGTVEDFLTKVAESHGGNEFGREYIATAAYLRALVEARQGEAVPS